MNIKTTVALAGLALATATVVYLTPEPVIPFVPTKKLAWQYTVSNSNIVFNVYRSKNILETNVSDAWNTKGSEDTNNWVYLGLQTNVYETWRDWVLYGTTTNLFYMIQSTGSFGFFRVKASNTVTKLESE